MNCAMRIQSEPRSGGRLSPRWCVEAQDGGNGGSPQDPEGLPPLPPSCAFTHHLEFELGKRPGATICRRSAAQQGRGFRRDITFITFFTHVPCLTWNRGAC